MADCPNNQEVPDFSSNEKCRQLKPRIGEKWREIQGEKWWKGLLEPMINPIVKAEILRYGDFAQLCYDSFDGQKYSKYYGSCKHSRETLFEKMGMSNCGYQVTKYLYANTAALSWLFREKGKLGGITGSGGHVWIGFVAVCTDEDEIRRLGRRDILIAWRGTETTQEWIHDFTDILVPARLSHAMSATTNHGLDSGVRIEKGFLTCYMSSSGSGDGLSARESVLKEVKRLVEKYGEHECLSITLTGHSLGGAVATLSAYDIAKQLQMVHSSSPVTVTVFAFASPRVGNPAFARQMEDVGVKVLRLVNKQDVVPKVPGILINENLGCQIPQLLSFLPWTYVHVGVHLTLDSNSSPLLKKHRIFKPTDLAGFHNLEVYLHLLDGFVGHAKPFKSCGRDPALVNKSSDFLIPRLLIPSYWWQDQNKGLVQDPHGRWTQRSLSYSNPN